MTWTTLIDVLMGIAAALLFVVLVEFWLSDEYGDSFFARAGKGANTNGGGTQWNSEWVRAVCVVAALLVFVVAG